MRVLGAISYFYFFYEEILHTKKSQNANKRLSLRYSYTPESFKKQTSDFRRFLCA